MPKLIRAATNEHRSERAERSIHPVLSAAHALAFGLALALAAGLCLASNAVAEEDARSITELKAAAYDAQQAAAAAEKAAAEAQAQAVEAQAAIEKAGQAPPAQPATPPVSAPPSSSIISQPAPAPVPTAPPAPPVIVVQTPPAPAPAPPPEAAAAAVPEPESDMVTREELERAMEKAEQAAAQARRAMEELEAYKEAQKKRYARNGFYLSGGAFWAPELFDANPAFDFDPSVGLSGGIGYRVHPHFSIDATFVWADGFDISNPDQASEWDDLQIWSALLGGRVFFLTGKIQPYVGVGFGASGGRSKLRDPSGVVLDEFKEVGGTIAFNGGFDLYLSENVALGADAAVYLPGGNMRGLDYSTLGAKLTYRF